MIWTTESIKEYDDDPNKIMRESKINSIIDNKDKFKSPYFNDIKGLRKSIKFKNTEDEIEYLLKLKKNPKLIDRNIKFKHLSGQTSSLCFTGIQEEIIDTIHNNRYIVLNTARQIGSSMAIFSYILYYLSVNNSKNILIISDKTSLYTIDSFISLYKSLDFFIKPGILKMNKSKIYFDNGNSILFNNSVPLGTNFDLIFLLDFAYHPNSEDILKHIMIYNMISSQVIIQSQPNKKDDTFSKLFLNDDKIWYRKKFTLSLIDEKSVIKKIGISSYLKEYLCLFPESKEYNRLSNIYKILEE